jgi:hypothetical protein
MAFVMDTNTFIQAKNEYYAFDLCPGFWDWIEQGLATGAILSIERVGRELEQGNDALAQWAQTRRGSFFKPLDGQTNTEMTRVSSWVQAGDFKDAAKRKFLADADPFVIAYAMAHGHTVVSHELHVEGQRSKVKIPTVCRALQVPCVRTFDMLRQSGARFVLERP